MFMFATQLTFATLMKINLANSRKEGEGGTALNIESCSAPFYFERKCTMATSMAPHVVKTFNKRFIETSEARRNTT